MMKLGAPQMERCIGCLLCVLASAREGERFSLENSAIRIVGATQPFSAQIDDGASVSDEVVKICPRNCLSLVEVT